MVSLNGTKLTFSTGWADVIFLKRYTTAIDAGKLIKEAGIEFDQAYTSVLNVRLNNKLGASKPRPTLGSS